VTGGWGEQHNDELRHWHAPPHALLLGRLTRG